MGYVNKERKGAKFSDWQRDRRAYYRDVMIMIITRSNGYVQKTHAK